MSGSSSIILLLCAQHNANMYYSVGMLPKRIDAKRLWHIFPGQRAYMDSPLGAPGGLGGSLLVQLALRYDVAFICSTNRSFHISLNLTLGVYCICEGCDMPDVMVDRCRAH
jgi:hypothetical protein